MPDPSSPNKKSPPSRKGHVPRVLLTDGHWAKTLAAARSLGQKGIEVTVGESTWIATTFFSRFCGRRWVYPSPYFQPEAFLEEMLRELRRRPYEALFPMEERTMLLLAQHRQEVERYTRLPVHEIAFLDRARRKDEVLKLAGELGIPAPRTFYPGPGKAIRELSPEWPCPAVIKPRLGSGSAGIAYVRERKDLWPAYQRVHRHYPWPLVQEFIPPGGAAVGVSFLFDENHEPVAHFTHKRIREYPVSGGPSTLRESIADPSVEKLAEKILRALEWFGVAMVEFRYDPRDGLPKLMEINPRFWGSLPLAVYAGADFPYWLYCLGTGRSIPPIQKYALGKRCRWILPGDLLHFFKNPRRFQMTPSFFRLFEKNTAHDFFSWSDPGPALGRVMTLFTLLYDRDMKRLLNDRTRG
jgi:predicted ATP-grasp superfamily ATP-dependent carboligase